MIIKILQPKNLSTVLCNTFTAFNLLMKTSLNRTHTVNQKTLQIIKKNPTSPKLMLSKNVNKNIVGASLSLSAPLFICMYSINTVVNMEYI